MTPNVGIALSSFTFFDILSSPVYVVVYVIFNR